MNDQTNKDFEDYYAKRLSWYPLTKTLNHPTRPDGEYLYDSTKSHWETWCECQKLNDARINTLNDAITEDKILEYHNRELLAANQVMLEALQKTSFICKELCNMKGIRHEQLLWLEFQKLWKTSDDAIDINLGDVTLVEIAEAEKMVEGVYVNGNWTPYLNHRMKDIPVGKHKIFAIQTKINT